MEIISDGITKDFVYHCSKCNLYWFRDEGFIEYRLAVFSPIRTKDCPACDGTRVSQETPERFLDMQRLGKKEITEDEYFSKWGELRHVV